jgi:hypothetical protein
VPVRRTRRPSSTARQAAGRLANTSGQVVTVTYGYDNNPNFGGTNSGCAITGTAIASG